MLRNLVYFALLFSALSCSHENGGPDTDTTSRQDQSQTASKTDADQSPETDWTAEFEQINAVLGLSQQEQAKLKAAFEARAIAFEQWRAENVANLARFEMQMKQAAKARDLTGLRQAKAKAAPLRNELRQLVKTHESKIQETLPPEYRLKWSAHLVSEMILKVMRPLNLSEQQISQVRTESLAAVRATANERNVKAAAYMKLEETVDRSVLTAEQRQTFQAIKKKKPLRSLK